MTQQLSNTFTITVTVSNDPYAGLTPGSWTVLPNNAPAAAVPHHGIMAFGNIAYDYDGQRFIFFGGGDKDYWGNDVWEYQIVAQQYVRHYPTDIGNETSPPSMETFIRQTDPSKHGMIGVEINNVWQPLNRPIPRHCAGSLIWMSHRQEMTMGAFSTYYSGTGNWTYIADEKQPPAVAWNRAGPTPLTNGGTIYGPGDHWHYKPALGKDGWTYKGCMRDTPGPATLNPLTNLYDPAGPIQTIIAGAYDASRQLVWVQTAIECRGGRSGTWAWPYAYEERYHTRFGKYNPDTAVFTNYGNPPNWSEYDANNAILFDPTRDRVYFVRGDDNTISAFNPATNTWAAPTTPSGTAPEGWKETTYAMSVVDDVIYACTPNDLFKLDLWTMAWSKIGGMPSGIEYGIKGHFHFDESRRVLFLFYVFQPSGGGTLRQAAYKLP